MEGEQYITFNPDTFADQTLWTYRDLQKLSKKVGKLLDAGKPAKKGVRILAVS